MAQDFLVGILSLLVWLEVNLVETLNMRSKICTHFALYTNEYLYGLA